MLGCEVDDNAGVWCWGGVVAYMGGTHGSCVGGVCMCLALGGVGVLGMIE